MNSKVRKYTMENAPCKDLDQPARPHSWSVFSGCFLMAKDSWFVMQTTMANQTGCIELHL